MRRRLIATCWWSRGAVSSTSSSERTRTSGHDARASAKAAGDECERRAMSGERVNGERWARRMCGDGGTGGGAAGGTKDDGERDGEARGATAATVVADVLAAVVAAAGGSGDVRRPVSR